MKKIYLIAIYILSSILVLNLLSEKTFAVCQDDPNDDFKPADTAHKYYYYNNGGIVPSTNSSLSSNCSVVTRVDGTATDDLQCSNLYYNHIIQYCNQGTSSVSTASGLVYIYSTNPAAGTVNYYKLTNNKTGKNYSFTKSPSNNEIQPIQTTVNVNTGESYVLNFGEKSINDGKGWRKIDLNTKINNSHKDFVNNVRAHAAANGFEIIAEQYWADATTISKFDTYDFEDVPIIIAVKNPAPKCEDHPVSLTVNPQEDPAVLYLGEKAKYTVSINNSSVYRNLSNVFNIGGTASIPFANGLLNEANQKCNINLGVQTCSVTNRVSFDKSQNYRTLVSWTHNYQVCNGAACNNCSATKEFSVYPYPGFTKTIYNGSTYIGKTVNIKRLPDGQYFTDRLILTQSDKFNTFEPLNKIIKPSNTNVTTVASNYQDINNRSGFHAWYKSKILSDPKFSEINTYNSVTVNNVLLNALKQKSTEVDLVYVKGDATINDSGVVNCIKPTIFVIDGNLNIQQNFEIPSNEDSACVFLVGNKTTVAASVRNINAFIITQLANTEVEGNLTLKGGLVIQGDNPDSTALLKNINATVVDANKIAKDTPSELLQYEGARYVNIFKDYLKEPFRLSIREIQYTNN